MLAELQRMELESEAGQLRAQLRDARQRHDAEIARLTAARDAAATDARVAAAEESALVKKQHSHALGELQARLQHERARAREAQERAHAQVRVAALEGPRRPLFRSLPPGMQLRPSPLPSPAGRRAHAQARARAGAGRPGSARRAAPVHARGRVVADERADGRVALRPRHGRARAVGGAR